MLEGAVRVGWSAVGEVLEKNVAVRMGVVRGGPGGGQNFALCFSFPDSFFLIFRSFQGFSWTLVSGHLAKPAKFWMVRGRGSRPKRTFP